MNPRPKQAKNHANRSEPVIRLWRTIGGKRVWSLLKASFVVRAALEDRHVEWRKFPLDHRFSVSRDGRVRDDEALGLRTPSRGSDYGHLVVAMNGKTRPLHRVIAMAWLGLPDGYEDMVVDHINRDPADNRIENLRWATHRQNMNNVTPRMRADRIAKSEALSLLDNAGIDDETIAKLLRLSPQGVEALRRRTARRQENDAPGQAHSPSI